MNWLSAFMPPWWKLAAAGMVLVALAGGVWKLRYGGIVAGRAEVQAAWDAEKLSLVSLARRLEADKQIANQKVDNEYQTTKTRAAAVDRTVTDGLRSYQAAAASAIADTAAACRTDDPRPAIARECTAALADMDKYARSLAGQVAGLQGYAGQVCVTQ